MANINAYDYANTGIQLARTVLGSTFDFKAKQKDIEVTKRGQDITKRGQDVQAEVAKYKTDIEAQVKREELQNRKDLQQMMNDNAIILKQMGIDSDQFIAKINNLSAEKRVELQNEMNKVIQLLKNQNVLDAIEAQYQANLKVENLKEDEAMKRAVLGELFNYISKGPTAVNRLARGVEGSLLVQLLKEMFPGIETWNDPNFVGTGGQDNGTEDALRKWQERQQQKVNYEQIVQERKEARERDLREGGPRIRTQEGRSKGLKR